MKSDTVYDSFSLCEDLLTPERPLNRQEIRLGEKKYYRLEHLRSLSSYEIKISYPATVSYSFLFEFCVYLIDL